MIASFSQLISRRGQTMQRTICSSVKFAANIKLIESRISLLNTAIRSMGSEWGSGAGKGGGSGGSIREAGGAFGKMESAHEEQYFRKKQREQLEDMKQHLHEEIDRHQALIKEHEEAIKKSKQKIEEMMKNKE